METENKKSLAFYEFLKKQNKPGRYPVYAFLLACASFLLSLAFLDIVGYGNQTIFRSDMHGQYIPFIQMFLRALKGEESFWYSFSLYLGSGTILTHAYYTLSPFNLLYLIDSISISAMTTVIITLKLGLSAATFQIFVQKALKQKQFFTVLLSVCYGLCGYAVTMHYHLMWLEAIYMLPIIVWLIMRFIETGRFKGLTLSFAYLFITNFYTAYMVGVFSAIFYICYLCYKHFQPTKEAVKKCFLLSLRFAGAILLAIGLSAIVLLPAAIFLFSNMAEDNASFPGLSATLPDIVNSMFVGQMQTLDTQVPMLYCGIPVLLILPFYFANKEISVKEKICFAIPMVFLLISCLFLPLYKFMHAFDYPNMYGFRFIFLLVFLMVTLACRQFPYMKASHIKTLCIYSGGLIVLYSLLIPMQNLSFPSSYYTNTQNGLVLNLLLIALWILLFYFTTSQKLNLGLVSVFAVFLLVGELSINAYISIDREEHGTVSEASINSHYRYLGDAIYSISATDSSITSDSSFYRIAANNILNYNLASYYGYNGITTFSSSDDYPLRYTLGHLGLATGNRVIEEKGLTPVMKMLLGVKYSVNLESTLSENDAVPYSGYTMLQNNMALPLGYMVSAQIVNYSATDNPFYNQIQLLTLMTEKECPPIYTALSMDDIQTISENMAIDFAETSINFYHLADSNLNSAISFSAPSVEGKELYACFTQVTPGVFSNSPVIVAQTQGVAGEYPLSYGSIVKGAPTNLHGSPHESVILYFYPERSWDYACNNIYFYYYDHSQLQSIYDDLAPGGWQIESYEDDCIRGTVTATEERPILFTTIPHDECWTAYVDGEETPIYSTLDEAFLSIILEPGTHEVILKYEAEGKSLGELLTTLSIGIFLMILLLEIARKNKTLEKKDMVAERKDNSENES